MARVLILDFDGRQGAALNAVLERHDHRGRVATTVHDALMELAKKNAHYDVVIFDLSRNRPSDWQNLDHVIAITMRNPGPMILCVSDFYHGPAMKLEIERKGGRLVWI
jgi:DNA-binding NtrC family response regulator